MAELLHNFVDLASAGVLVVGLKLAARKSTAFPYGLYKIENLVAAGLAVMIFLTAYEIVSLVFLERGETPDVDMWMLASLGATTLVPLAFSHFELRVAHRTNSPALLADAREYRVHVYTTGLALAALLTAWFALPFDQVAALIIAAAVVKTGWDLLADAFRVLLDASLDATSLGKIRRIIGSDPAVSDVNWMTGRNAGRFRFVEAGITLRLADLVKAQVAIRRIETAVRSAMPQVERILLHVEPHVSTRLRFAVPVTDLSGTISEHFGEAPYFAFVSLDRASGVVEEQHIHANPYQTEERAKGLRVAEWLAEQKADRVVVPRSLEGRGPTYVFREAGIDVTRSEAHTIVEFVAEAKATI